MRIVHINLSPPGFGGIERLLVDFLRFFRGTEFQVELCILGAENTVSHELASESYQITHLDRRTDTVDWALWGRLAAHLRKVNCDVVHLHGNPGLTFGVPATYLGARLPIVYTCHFGYSNHSALRHAFLGGLLKLVDRRVAVSEAARQVLVSLYHQRRDSIEIIRNGVDTARFQPRERPVRDGKPTVIGFCGMFRPEKQIDVLIDCFAILRREGRDVRLSLVGDGAELDRCRRRAHELNLSDMVVFHGPVMDVRPLVAEMDVFVLPSREEAMPMSLLEAMALGCAPVASRVGGVPEVIEDRKSGFMVTIGDKEQLTAALRELVVDHETRLRVGVEARARVEAEFSLSTMMGRYAELYRSILR